MASVVTLRPTSTIQTGLGTVAPSGTAHAALADGLDTTYVQLTGRARTDGQVVRVGFPTPSIPAGAKVYSVAIRDRVQTVQTTTTYPTPPVCYHWLRCLLGEILVAGQTQDVKKSYFPSTCPSTTTTTTPWVDRNLGEFPTGPGGTEWDVATTLSGLTYDIGRGDDSGLTLRYAALFLDVTYQQISTVTVTGPTGSSTSTRPTVTWTYSSPDSQPQQAYRVAVYTAAQVADTGFTPFISTSQQESGWLLGEDLQWTLTQDIVDGSYVAYVQATSKWAGSGDFPTDVASTSWTRAAAPADPPPSPVLSSAVFDPTGTGRVVLSFAPGGTTPVTTAFTVQRSIDNGVTFTDIPHLRYVPADGMSTVTGYDYTAPFNVISKYRVIAYTGTPFVGSADPSGELSVTPSGDNHTLVHPTNPLLSTIWPEAAPKSGEGKKVTLKMLQGKFQPISGNGIVRPIFTQGPVYGYQLDREAIFIRGEDSEAYWPAVEQIITSGSTLLFNLPDGTQYWVRVDATEQDPEWTYDAIPGYPRAVYWRRLKVRFSQVDPPALY